VMVSFHKNSRPEWQEYENPPSVKNKLNEPFLSILLGWIVSHPYQNLGVDISFCPRASVRLPSRLNIYSH
jgi:hypothetical protein